MFKKHRNLVIIFLVAVIYFVSGRLSISLAFDNTNASPVWPPAGLAFAAVLIFGRKALWGIFVGALAINLSTFSGNHPFSANVLLCSLLIGLGNTLEAYLGERFYRSFSGEESPLKTYQNYFKMLMVTFVACLLCALVATVSLLLTNLIPFDLSKTILVTWWIGDYVGILILSPLLLALANSANYFDSKEKKLEYTISLVIVIGVSSIIFSNVSQGTVLAELSFLLIPFLLWMAYRFSVPYIAAAVLIVSLISVFGTVNGYGPFVRQELNESLLLLQTFMGTISVTFVALSITLNKKFEKAGELKIEGFPKSALWFTSISFILVLAVSLFIIQEQDKKNNESIKVRMVQNHQELTKSMVNEIENIVKGLKRMASRRGYEKGLDQGAWLNDAKNYYKDGLFKAIEWVDSSYRVRWVYPLEGNENALGVNLSFEPKRKHTLELAKKTKGSIISEPVDLLQGGRGLLITVPVFNGEEFLGYILGVFKMKSMFSNFLESYKEDYFIELSIGDIIAYKSEDFHDNFFKVSASGGFSTLKWKMTLVPKPKLLNLLGKESNSFSVILAFLISVLFSLTVYLVFYARSRARHLSQLNFSLLRNNEELNKEKEISQQAAIAKSEFLANMSHEIRTPMNGVLGALQLAMDSRDSEIRNYLKVIDISAKNLMDIINDILDYSKIEAGKLNLELIPFDMSKIVNESLIILEGKASLQKIELCTDFQIDPEQNFKGDPVRIRQILLNLLSNAVKFTSKGSVTVKTYMNSADQVCLDVIDTGIGIPLEKQKHIFEQFSQADTSTTREYGGTGLGLAITSQLVKLMDGTIEVESTIGEGAVFRVVLPLEQTDIKLVESKKDLQRKYGKRVLLCEDNKTNQAVIKETLNRLGIDVEIVDNGLEALKLIDTTENEFDLIFMDLHMPQMDGFESTSEILKIMPNTPIIALTANTREEDRKKCFEQGMKGYITKPIHKNRLINELDKWFGKAS
ncbi:MAG: MASE1 domain-containing protein [Lentisphaeraceae bacterium]|nr:MASE1 domain-containing protein [Lentisphaeraceae bacterium]